LIDEGKAAEAVIEFEEAIAKRSKPGTAVRVYSNRYIVYIPHLYLAISAQMSGDMDKAKSSLENAKELGVAGETEVGKTLIPAYEVLLARTNSNSAASVDDTENRGNFRAFEDKEEVLSEVEYDELRLQVEERCGLSGTTEKSKMAWYFHYEMGLALSDRDDPQRALESLISAVDRRPASQRDARMYGMWFTDYLPYYQIARAHMALSNWECALDALEVSRKMGEIDEDDKEYTEFWKMLEESRNLAR
jgi:tetratricopeptide (TPR) repeat protein